LTAEGDVQKGPGQGEKSKTSRNDGPATPSHSNKQQVAGDTPKGID